MELVILTVLIFGGAVGLMCVFFVGDAVAKDIGERNKKD